MKSKADWCETVLHRKASEWKYKLKKKKKKKEAASSIKNGLVFFFFDRVPVVPLLRIEFIVMVHIHLLSQKSIYKV